MVRDGRYEGNRPVTEAVVRSLAIDASMQGGRLVAQAG